MLCNYRLKLCYLVMQDAKLLLFDEPTSGLDYAHMVKVGELLRDLAKAGNTVLVATHDPELVEICCDALLCIENGKVRYMRYMRKGLAESGGESDNA